MTTLESCNKHNIVNWEYILLGMTEAKDSEVCKITRADGTSSFHGDFQALLRRLDRQDLFQLYSLVQERYKHRSIEGHDLDLWGDLKMMFDPNEEDDIWLNQHYWELLRWKLHEYSGVHSLFLDGTSIQINMLVDKKYPLKKEILKKMINLKIEAEEESDMASELIKFIKSQIAEQRFVDKYPNFQEDKNNVSFLGVVLGVEEESMPAYDTDIEDVIEEEEGFVGKGGCGGGKDSIEDVVVVANDLCSSINQTTLSVDFEVDINTKSHELISFGKKYYYHG
ncbi:hypothetical protein Tco_1538774 [Tanacetum coccineum]